MRPTRATKTRRWRATKKARAKDGTGATKGTSTVLCQPRSAQAGHHQLMSVVPATDVTVEAWNTIQTRLRGHGRCNQIRQLWCRRSKDWPCAGASPVTPDPSL